MMSIEAENIPVAQNTKTSDPLEAIQCRYKGQVGNLKGPEITYALKDQKLKMQYAEAENR